jgi:hypothetical protein
MRYPLGMLPARRALLVVPSLVLVACSTVVVPRGDSGSTAGGEGSQAPHAEPPPPGAATPPNASAHLVFAIKSLTLGDADAKPGVSGGWRHLGYDVDGKISTAASTDLCKPRDNALPESVYPDGDDGIDNAFGKNELPIYHGLEPNFPGSLGASFAAGRPTLLIAVDGLGAGVSYASLAARLYRGAELGHAAAFDGSDAWPVRPESLSDPADVGSALVRSTASYLVGDTWVGRFTGDVDLELPLEPNVLLHVPIRDPVLSMRLAPDHKTATGGVLSGVIPTDAFVFDMKKDAVQLDPTLWCYSSTPESFFAQLEQASDILEDGTQDPAKRCDGISIGLGFEAVRAAVGPIAPPLPPPPDLCALDAGSPGGG